MIDRYDILALYREEYGTQEPEQTVLAHCVTAAAELESRIRPGVGRGDVRLLKLAAAMVRYAVCKKNSADSEAVTSFKAGDVTVKTDTRVFAENARRDIETAEAQAAPLLKDINPEGLRAV